MKHVLQRSGEKGIIVSTMGVTVEILWQLVTVRSDCFPVPASALSVLFLLPVDFHPRNSQSSEKKEKQNNLTISKVQVVLQKSCSWEESVG